jgi:hypothetical protein
LSIIKAQCSLSTPSNGMLIVSLFVVAITVIVQQSYHYAQAKPLHNYG